LWFTLTPEQRMKASISKAAALIGQRLHPLANVKVIAVCLILQRIVIRQK